eukprot:TRINITY_DN1509_c1_g1_i3.p1 TRINITY_DN1509_c1_g1~~TRINITY_DN1509_c1_g1_i3.p1  ORF type:complete len:238 (-),score=84.92 TRINITY_DN1509_c1_g1_i3:67-729(-)
MSSELNFEEQVEIAVQKIQKKRSSQKELDLLVLLIESKLRHSNLILKLGKHLSEHTKISSFWNFVEPIFFAAIDVGNLEEGNKILTILRNKFGETHRIRRLHGLLLESQQNWEGAKNIYHQIIKESGDICSASYLLVQKRLIVIEKAQGKYREAINLLNDLVERFRNDEAIWFELAELNLLVLDYSSAAKCFEELLLIIPENSQIYIKYAEVNLIILIIE